MSMISGRIVEQGRQVYSVEEGVEGKWVRVVVGLGEECMKTVGRPFRFRVVNALHFKIRENLRS